MHALHLVRPLADKQHVANDVYNCRYGQFNLLSFHRKLHSKTLESDTVIQIFLRFTRTTPFAVWISASPEFLSRMYAR